MGYRDDGFFNITWSNEGNNAGPVYGGSTNPKFIYPDRNIRFLEAQASLQRKFNEAKDTLARGNYKIHRGYIRNLEQPQFGPIPINRCNFQFNPQEIRQSVAMREDMYIPLLQTVEQLAQPVGAVVNFTFDLMFDRSHELSAGAVRGSLTPDQLERGQADPVNTDMYAPNSERDPYDIGVLADLRTLYAAIGQGFSKEMIRFQKERFRLKEDFDIKNEADSDGTSTGEEDTSSGTTTSTSSQKMKDEDLNRILDNNYGNWGLLMPNPVRVMFSSLFMLDGFITGTNVDFLKFNTNMVPLMCRVTMNMSAMYIGFAKEETFIVRTFRDAADALAESNRQDEETKREILKALSTTGSQFIVSANGNSSWNNSAKLNIDPYPVYGLVINDDVSEVDYDNDGVSETIRGLTLGFTKVQPIPGSNTRTNPDGSTSEEGRDIDDILRLFEDSGGLTVAYDWELSVYGPIIAANKLTYVEANKLVENNKYLSDDRIKLVGKYSGTEKATSDKEWGKGASGEDNSRTRVRRRIYFGGDELPNKAKTNYAIHQYLTVSDIDDFVKTGSYIVKFDLTITVTYGNAGELQITKNIVQAISGLSQFRRLININWVGESADLPTFPIRYT